MIDGDAMTRSDKLEVLRAANDALKDAQEKSEELSISIGALENLQAVAERYNLNLRKIQDFVIYLNEEFLRTETEIDILHADYARLKKHE